MHTPRVRTRQDRLQRIVCIALALLMTGVLGWVDCHQRGDRALSLLYLLPIGMATWFGGPWRGALLSLLSAGLWLGADLRSHRQPLPLGTVTWNAVVGLDFFLTLTFTLSFLKRLLEREQEQARTDALTGLANGRSFYELAGVELERARRHRHPITLAYVDLDNFKAVNDRFGHATGDDCLRMVGGLLRGHVRAADIVARLGGDEFAILLAETPFAQAGQALGKVREMLNGAMAARGWPVTVSIGAMAFVDLPDTAHEMIRQVDALMYSVKHSGKNSIRLEAHGG